MGGTGILMRSERGLVQVEGSLYVRVASLIDGRRTTEEIVGLLQHESSRAEVYYALEQLGERGLVVEAPKTGVSDAAAAFWHASGRDPDAAFRLLRDATVHVRSPLATFAETFAGALAATGVRVGGDGQVAVVPTDDYLRAELAGVNRDMLTRHLPWLLVKPVGTVLWIGPLLVPGRTGCWECLAHRMRLHRLDAFDAPDTTVPVELPQAEVPGGLHIAAGVAALRLAEFIAERDDHSPHADLFTLDLLTMLLERHPVERRPQCVECGDPQLYAQRAGRAMALETRPIAFVNGGGHRSEAPASFLARADRLISPVTGIVAELRPIPLTGISGVHVVAAGRIPRLRGRSWAGGRHPLREFCGGKGLDAAQASASALGEAVERYAALFQGDEPRSRTTARELGDEAIDPNRCMLFSDMQYADPEARDPFPIPRPFDSAMPLDWTPIWSLTAETRRYLPTALVYMNHSEPADRAVCCADSNGNAAGATLEDAVLQGLFELIERDAAAIWWYNRLQRPAVAVDAHVPQMDIIRAGYRARGRDLWVLDLTGDLGVPTFAAVSRRLDPPDAILLGFGAHLDPLVAASRALSEVSQLLLTEEVWRDQPASVAAPLRAWLDEATVAAHPYVAPAPGEPVPLSHHATIAGDDLAADIRTCQRLLEARGLEVLVLDLTRPDIDVAVAKVIAPGLRHFRSRFAPGRLYDVPVAMGWIDRCLTEPELNPIPFFL